MKELFFNDTNERVTLG